LYYTSQSPNYGRLQALELTGDAKQGALTGRQHYGKNRSVTTFFIEAHRTLSNMILIYTVIVGIWGVFNAFRRMPPDGNFNGALALAVALFVIEGLAGMLLVLLGLRPARIIHFLYGVTIVLTIPAIFAFSRGRNTSRESLLYGLAMLFIAGLADRAAQTALVGD
jgi:heme A synthase